MCVQCVRSVFVGALLLLRVIGAAALNQKIKPSANRRHARDCQL